MKFPISQEPIFMRAMLFLPKISTVYGLPPNSIIKIVTIACLCISCLIGVVGNGLVIWISGFRMKTVSAVWFTNLAIVDFLLCVSLPLRVIEGTLPYSWDENVEIRRLNNIALYLNSNISVVFMTAICIDYCVTIMWPLWARRHRTLSIALLCSVFLWLIPSVTVITYELKLSVVIHKYYNWYAYEMQGFFYDVGNNLKYIQFLRSCFTFSISFTIIFVCYMLIMFKLCSNKTSRPQKILRGFKMSLIVVFSYFICWLPFNVWPLVAKEGYMDPKNADFIVSCVSFCLATFSGSVNPILYVLMGRKVKNNANRSIKARIEKTIKDLTSFHPCYTLDEEHGSFTS